MVRGFKNPDKIKLAVVTGGHPFDVPGFRDTFERMPQVDYYIQELDNWAFDDGRVSDQYDVILFYNMHSWNILSVRKDADDRVLAALERLGETEQGILVLHHALLNFRESQTWSRICNIQDRSLHGYHPNVNLATHIANPDHPITRGLNDWQRVDETFEMNEPGPGGDILLTTDNPQSMKALGWGHEHKNARVFCYQGGHDNQTYIDPTFQAVLHRGIQWLARRI